LVPVPVDVDPESLEPCPDALRAALSPRSRVLVSAHLFGAVVEMEPSRAFAREHGLLFVEDYAQSFAPGRFRGHGDYDVRMLSFGPIKTATAMGGGVLFVRDPVVRDRMERLQARYPVQPRGAYVRRLVKYGAMQLMAARPLFALFRAGCRLAGKDFDAVLREAARGFRGADLFGHLRRRPSVPLLAVMARRLGPDHDHGHTEARAAAGQALANALPMEVVRPGSLVDDHTHWVFPVLTPDPTGLMGYLRLQGFDSTQGASSLTAVEPPPERPDVRIPRAEAMMARLLFLPAYPEIPVGERLRLARELGVWNNGSAPATHVTSTLVVGSRRA